MLIEINQQLNRLVQQIIASVESTELDRLLSQGRDLDSIVRHELQKRVVRRNFKEFAQETQKEIEKGVFIVMFAGVQNPMNEATYKINIICRQWVGEHPEDGQIEYVEFQMVEDIKRGLLFNDRLATQHPTEKLYLEMFMPDFNATEIVLEIVSIVCSQQIYVPYAMAWLECQFSELNFERSRS